MIHPHIQNGDSRNHNGGHTRMFISENAVHRPLEHRMTRRCAWNDYRAKRIYMITLSKSKAAPELAKISGNPKIAPGFAGAPASEASWIGNIIEQKLLNIDNLHPALQVLSLIIMPDHIHFILFVKESIPKPIGHYIGKLKGEITRALWNERPDLERQSIGCFENGFHDRILLKRGQLATMKRYIADNPRRLMLKQKFPDIFQCIKGITIDDLMLDCYGNPFLLSHDLKEQIWVRSAWSDDDFNRKRAQWRKYASNGAVMISPFISKREKIIRDDALAAGASIILIRNEKFPERFKPEGRLFDLCAEGRLLIVVDHNAEEYSPTLCRLAAQKMNALAGRLTQLTHEQMKLHLRQRK